jgi:hypothetical protein
MDREEQIICTAECPACGEQIEFTDIGIIKECPCGGAEGELTVEWRILEDKDDG